MVRERREKRTSEKGRVRREKGDKVEQRLTATKRNMTLQNWQSGWGKHRWASFCNLGVGAARIFTSGMVGHLDGHE